MVTQDQAAGFRWRADLTSACLALFVVAATLVGSNQHEAMVFTPPDAWVECLIFVTAGATFVARRVPYVALAIATLLDALPYWLPIGGAGYHVSLMITVYTVVAYRPSRRALPAVAAVLVVQVVLMARDMDWLWNSRYVVIAAVTVVFPAALGLAAHSRALAAEAFRERALTAERFREADARKLLAEDRLRTARDLHDSVAHQIAVMNLNAGVASQSLRDRPEVAESALMTVREAGRSVISSITDLLTGLRAGEGDDAEPRYTLTDLQVLIEEFRKLSPELTVTFAVADDAETRPVSPVVYAVVREALTNAYKHGAHGSPVVVRVGLDERASSVEVVNTPSGRTSSSTAGFGLRGMRERVTAAGGRVSVRAADGRFTLRAEVPLARSGP